MGRKTGNWRTAVCLLFFLMIGTTCTAPPAEEPNSGKVEVMASGTVMPPTRGDVVVDLPDLGEAPEFLNDVWLNSDKPVRLRDQRGKVVLLEFWTFG